jgi:hypothetical protein
VSGFRRDAADRLWRPTLRLTHWRRGTLLPGAKRSGGFRLERQVRLPRFIEEFGGPLRRELALDQLAFPLEAFELQIPDAVGALVLRASWPTSQPNTMPSRVKLTINALPSLPKLASNSGFWTDFGSFSVRITVMASLPENGSRFTRK